jgi:hypothetical protein
MTNNLRNNKFQKVQSRKILTRTYQIKSPGKIQSRNKKFLSAVKEDADIHNNHFQLGIRNSSVQSRKMLTHIITIRNKKFLSAVKEDADAPNNNQI